MKKITYQENKNIIAAQLHRIRTEHGLSQAALAAKMQLLGVHMDQQMISKIEHNMRIVTDYELACFCYILHIPPEKLLSDFQP